MKKAYIYIIIASFFLCFSCQSSKECDLNSIDFTPQDVKIERLEKTLFSLKTEEDIIEFLKANPVLSNYFFYANEYPSLDILSKKILSIISNPSADTLYREAVASFDKNEEKFKKDLDIAMGLLNYYLPQSKKVRVQTIVSGFFNDVFISDTLIIIGIEYFIGENATFKPYHLPAYILRRYNYDHLAPMILNYVVEPHIQFGSENTLISEMIDYGKVYYLLEKIFPCTPDTLLIGFTSEEMNAVKKQQEIVWASFIENNVLFEVNEFTKKKFLGERPNVYEIGKNCPGRIGAWVGWQIVKKYMEKSNIDIEKLFNETNHHKIFDLSKYKPINEN